jgi:hypothetical protein
MPKTMGTKEPVMIGEWAVADRVVVTRGEYVDRNYRIELPVWSASHNDFLIPVDHPGRDKKIPGIEVPFSNERPDGLETILLDFEGGGRQVYKHVLSRNEDEAQTKDVDDVSSAEVLLLTPEGRLLGHDSALDATDPERKKNREMVLNRVDHFKKKAEAAKATTTPTGPGGNPFGGPGSGKSPGSGQ